MRAWIRYTYIGVIALLFLAAVLILRSAPEGIPAASDRESANVLAVLRYIDEGYNGRNAEVLRDALAPDFIQHAPYIPDGTEGFLGFYRGVAEEYPAMHMQVHRIFAEGEFVVLHNHLLFDRDGSAEGLALVDLFRLDDSARIAEYWGVAQPVDGDASFDGRVSKRTTFVNFIRAVRDSGDPNWREKAGIFDARVSEKHREVNKEVVREYSRLMVDPENPRLRELVADDLIRHHPGVPVGAADIRRMVTDGEFVVAQTHYTVPGTVAGLYAFDIYRVVGSRIVEHWRAAVDLADLEDSRVDGNTNSVL